MKNIINRALAAEKRLLIFLVAVVMAAGGMRAEEHSYVWNAEFPNTTASGQGLEDLQDGEATPRKIIYNGQVYILRSGHSYTLTGTEVIPQK